MRSRGRRGAPKCESPRTVRYAVLTVLSAGILALTPYAAATEDALVPAPLENQRNGETDELESSDIRLLLDAAGLAGFRVLDRTEIVDYWPDASFVWSNDHSIEKNEELVLGVLAEYPVASRAEFDKIVRGVVIDWSNGCGGKPRVRLGSRATLAAGEFTRRVTIECEDAAAVFISRAFFVGGDNSIVGFAHFYASPARVHGDAADSAMYRTFIGIIDN